MSLKWRPEFAVPPPIEAAAYRHYQTNPTRSRDPGIHD